MIEGFTDHPWELSTLQRVREPAGKANPEVVRSFLTRDRTETSPLHPGDQALSSTICEATTRSLPAART